MEGKNWSYTITEGEHAGVTVWSGRYTAVCGIVIGFHEDDIKKRYVLANKRGKGCPDFNGMWNLPCGFLEGYETGEQGVAREIHEECGISIESDNFTLFYVETDPKKCNNGNVTLRYLTSVCIDDYKKVDELSGEENEVEDIKWIPLSEYENYEWAFNHKEVIKEIKERYELVDQISNFGQEEESED